MSNAKIVNDYGTITVSSAVIANIAGEVVKRCYGVTEMAPKGGVKDFLKKDNSRGIVVHSREHGIDVDIHIAVKYGINMKAASDSIANDVKYQVELITGFKVGKVTVSVDNVNID